MRHTLILALLVIHSTAFAQFFPVYVPPTKPDYVQAEAAFKSAGLLERTANALNSAVNMPYRMPLNLRECGQVNAFYNRQDRTITLCYELMEQVLTGIEKDFGSAPPDRKFGASFGALFFILFHEVGHALTHVLSLPVLGKEEDAADAIATYVMLNTPNPTPTVLGTLWFFRSSPSQPSLRDYADEHSLNPQRSFSLLCYATGKDPANFGPMASKAGMPAERMQRCPSEYLNLKKSVIQLMGRHLVVK